MKELTYVAAAREGLAEEMERDATIFVVGEGIGPRGGNFQTTLGLYEKYGPERLRDTPIAERGFVGMCTGAAASGARPIVDFMFVDFILDAVGEILNQTSKLQYMSNGRLKMPIVLRGCIGVGGAAATHHSGSYFPLFVNQPGLRVVVPTTPADAKGLLKTAIRDDDPVLFMESETLYNVKGEVPDDPELLVPMGVASVAREGDDVTIISWSRMVHVSLEAAAELEKQGIHAEVIDLRSLRPLDEATIVKSVTKTHRAVLAYEGWPYGGVGGEIVDRIQRFAFDDLDAPPARVANPNVPTPFNRTLEELSIPSAHQIAQAARQLMA